MRLLAALTFAASVARAQDSVSTLTFEEFYRVVAANHPVVRQALLLESIAAGNERGARGAFDPTLTASWDRKQFEGKEYYDYIDAAVKIPTWLGFDIKLGYERAAGIFQSEDRTTPGSGLLTAGLSIPIGQRLLTDERRTAVAQARAMRAYAAGERAAMVNKLLLTAAKAYGLWYEGFRRERFGEEALGLATFRLNALRARVLQGDAAAIDTLEAGLEVQRRRVQLAEARLAFRNTSMLVEGMLWDDRAQPAALAAGSIPSFAGLDPGVVDAARLSQWIAQAERAHPDLLKAIAKVREGDAERSLAQQRVFVPDAEVSLSGLAARADGTPNPGAAFDADGDRKLGASVKIPLLFRKERGKLQATSDKLDQLTLDRSIVKRGVGISIQTSANDLSTLRELAALQAQTVTQARLLRDGEQRKFEAGESTLFLVNTRERVVIDEELKRIALEAKLVSTAAELAVSLGLPKLTPN